MTSKMVKAIGVMTTVIGMGVQLMTSWVDDKKMDETIEKKVNDALAKKNKDEAEGS